MRGRPGGVRDRVVKIATLGQTRTTGEATRAVASLDEPRELRRRRIGLSADVEDRAGHRVGNQSPPDAPRGALASVLSVDRSVASELGWLFTDATQDVHRHGDLDLRRPTAPTGQSDGLDGVEHAARQRGNEWRGQRISAQLSEGPA